MDQCTARSEDDRQQHRTVRGSGRKHRSTCAWHGAESKYSTLERDALLQVLRVVPHVLPSHRRTCAFPGAIAMSLCNCAVTFACAPVSLSKLPRRHRVLRHKVEVTCGPHKSRCVWHREGGNAQRCGVARIVGERHLVIRERLGVLALAIQEHRAELAAAQRWPMRAASRCSRRARTSHPSHEQALHDAPHLGAHHRRVTVLAHTLEGRKVGASGQMELHVAPVTLLSEDAPTFSGVSSQRAQARAQNRRSTLPSDRA